jgi:hypothetical protein
VMNSRRLMGRTPRPKDQPVKYSRSDPCIAAKAGRSCPSRVDGVEKGLVIIDEP